MSQILEHLLSQRDLKRWDDYEIENSLSIVINDGFTTSEDFNESNAIVPFKELCLYVACAQAEDKNYMFHMPEKLHDRVKAKIPKIISDAVASISKGIVEYKPEEHDNDLLRAYLGEYSSNFIGRDAVKSQRVIRTYHEAKTVFMLIEEWKKYLSDNNITRENLIKKSTNNTRGYKAQTVTELKEIIRDNISRRLVTKGDTSKRKRRITTRVIELILQ